jgi:hypothetical protein
VAIAATLAVSSLFGSLAMDVVTYPFSRTLVNQTSGLKAASVLVVLWSLVAV